MIKIGEFTKLSRISIRMLRHYDEIGLLVPEETDPWTGYRRYAAAQLMTANHDVERLVYKQAVWQYSGVLRTLQQILFLSLEKRLATFLLDECRRRKAQSFSASHVQIARIIGSSREVVTRMRNQFADRGLVKLGRGSVTVLDPDGLEDILL